MLKLDELKRYKIWEQYTTSGKKYVENYSRLLSYLSNVREFQADLGCGRVYTSSYLGVQPKGNTPDRKYILVIEMLPVRGFTYKNQPVNHVRFVLGGYRAKDDARGQVIVNVHDFHQLDHYEKLVFNCGDPVETIKPILEEFIEHGLKPVKSSDYFFGQYKTQLQYVYDGITNVLSHEDMKLLREKLDEFEFDFMETRCKKRFGNFMLSVSKKNMYGSYILAFQDLEEKVSIHWALKGEELVQTIVDLLQIYERWKS